MLEMLAALAVLSALILMGIVFRPTPLQIARRTDAVAARETDMFSVLGAFPTQAAIDSYEAVMRSASQAGVTVDWDRARREQAASSDAHVSLPVIALRQV
ncbi:MAG TPA: hypothetical protein VHL52_00900 [Acidimicrobiia bacterium]|nr:hypothetical protein [Acidimicrobiia bacterium]